MLLFQAYSLFVCFFVVLSNHWSDYLTSGCTTCICYGLCTCGQIHISVCLAAGIMICMYIGLPYDTPAILLAGLSVCQPYDTNICLPAVRITVIQVCQPFRLQINKHFCIPTPCRNQVEASGTGGSEWNR
ncbi:hypothetical protein SAMN05444001_110113 [Parabacteroides chinchillae]|uniref:Uncharacterized protein n=1 Tax=Parabacteroides chinchillae TaxID=871327 RepID=A0A8G2BWY4_9BACT|nr:hypothetical protein SAMN05444001_110113 [Parabacteroides chinchillae]